MRLLIHRGVGSCNVRNVVVVNAIILRGVFIIAVYVFFHKVFSLFQGEASPTCRLNWLMREGERVSVGINGQHSLWIYKFKQSSK